MDNGHLRLKICTGQVKLLSTAYWEFNPGIRGLDRCPEIGFSVLAVNLLDTDVINVMFPTEPFAAKSLKPDVRELS